MFDQHGVLELSGCERYCNKGVFFLKVHMALHWRHNGHDGVSNHRPHGCLLNRLFRRRSKKTSKLRVTGLCAWNSPGPVNSPHKGPVTRKMFPFDDVIMVFFLSMYVCLCVKASVVSILFCSVPLGHIDSSQWMCVIRLPMPMKVVFNRVIYKVITPCFYQNRLHGLEFWIVYSYFIVTLSI